MRAGKRKKLVKRRLQNVKGVMRVTVQENKQGD